MAELVIKQGEEFKAAVRGKITENDIFCKQYQDATEMLNEMVVSVNCTQVQAEDILSDHIYVYEYLSDTVTY